MRIKRRNKLENTGISVDVKRREVKTTVFPGIEDEDIRVGEEATIIEEDEETESLIREYQRNAIPNLDNLRLVEFYGGEEWRKDEGAEMSRCIQRILEKELVDEYQKNAEPNEEVKRELDEKIEEKWREDQGVSGRNYILLLCDYGRIVRALCWHVSRVRKEKNRGQDISSCKTSYNAGELRLRRYVKKISCFSSLKPL